MPHEETSLIRGRRPSVVKIQEEEQIQVPVGFKLFVKMMEWAPLWCFLFIDNVTYAYTAAFVVVVFNLFLTYMQHKMGTFAEWPKPLDVIFVAVFGLLTILTWMYQENVETIEKYSSAALNGGLALGFLVSWLFGRPVVRGYQVYKLGEAKASHPVIVHMASRLSVMFTVAFASIAVIATIYTDSDWTFLICNLIGVGAILTAYRFYPAYVVKHADEIADLYRDEIDEWEAKHPEENLY